MPIHGGDEYYRGRRRASLAMAIAAADRGVRKIHLEFARLYAVRANDLDESKRIRLTLSLSKKDGS